MPRLTRPLYQRSEGVDDDRWLLVLDTDANRLFVEHETTRGDLRGPGYATSSDEIGIADFLGGRGLGQQELVRLLTELFEDRSDPPPRLDHVGFAPPSMT